MMTAADRYWYNLVCSPCDQPTCTSPQSIARQATKIFLSIVTLSQLTCDLLRRELAMRFRSGQAVEVSAKMTIRNKKAEEPVESWAFDPPSSTQFESALSSRKPAIRSCANTLSVLVDLSPV